MNKTILIILVIAGIGILGYQIFFPLNKIKMKHAPEEYFRSKKVQKFCYALVENDFKTTDKLLKKGLDINIIGTKVKNKRKDGYAPTILTWLFLANKDTPEKLKAFEYLLKHGANPIIPHNKYNATMLFEAAGYEYPDYLKLILKYGNLKKEDLNIDLNTGTMNSPLLHAMAINRFENFKLLLDAGADMNWVESKTGETTLYHCSGRGSWKFAYELLKRGVDYSKDSDGIKSRIESTVGSIYSPATSIDFRGIDWRQKVVQFFREKGIEIKPGMSKRERYVNENGKDVLYVNEGVTSDGKRIEDKPDKWIKISESTFYEKATKDPDQQKYLNKEIEKMKIERLKD